MRRSVQTRTNLHQLHPWSSNLYIPVGPYFNRSNLSPIPSVSPPNLAVHQRRKNSESVHMSAIWLWQQLCHVSWRQSWTSRKGPSQRAFRYLWIVLFVSCHSPPLLMPFSAPSKFRLLRRTRTSHCTRLLEESWWTIRLSTSGLVHTYDETSLVLILCK